MQGQDNIIAFSGRSKRRQVFKLDAKTQRIVSDCRNLISEALPKLIAELFDKLDDSLYELANKSVNNTLQASFFAAMRALRKERVHVNKAFICHMLASFDDYWETGRYATVQHSLDAVRLDSQLELVDNDDLEDSLAINNMVLKSENRYSRERYALGQRFLFMLAGKLQESTSAGQRSPLEPVVFCNAFRSAIHEVPIELPAKLVVYKHFEKYVLYYLGGLYDDINHLLVRSGIIPQLTPKPWPNPVLPALQRRGLRSSPRRDNSYLSRDNPSVGSYSSGMIESLQDEVFIALQALLNPRKSTEDVSRLGNESYASENANTSLPAVDTRELLAALSTLQNSHDLALSQETDQLINARLLRLRLGDDLKLREGAEITRTLSKIDDDTIDVISMLFEFMLDDSRLPDTLKALLSRLQIPLVKLAIIDKSFFGQKAHPARRLLNNMAQAAIGWNDQHENETDSLRNMLESIVKRVIDEFHDDLTIFSDLDQEFTLWWEKEQQNAEIAEQRTNQVTRGKEQLQNAKQVVIRELNMRLQAVNTVPEAVMQILEDGWKDVLLLNYLRQGPESEEWKESLEIVDHLLWSVLPKSEYKERQELLRSIPGLLRNLREHLNRISFDQHKMAKLFKELQNCHIASLRSNDVYMAKSAGTAPVKSKQISFPDSQIRSGGSPGLTQQAKDISAPQHDRYTRQAEKLELGSWLEIIDKGARSRVKLSWKSNVTDAFIFVNRKGMKAMELNLQGLARRLREGSAKVVDLTEVPITDHAIDSLLSSLKSADQHDTSA
jgi:hypothetical protein